MLKRWSTNHPDAIRQTVSGPRRSKLGRTRSRQNGIWSNSELWSPIHDILERSLELFLGHPSHVIWLCPPTSLRQFVALAGQSR